jgi:hypothetical protein
VRGGSNFDYFPLTLALSPIGGIGENLKNSAGYCDWAGLPGFLNRFASKNLAGTPLTRYQSTSRKIK